MHGFDFHHFDPGCEDLKAKDQDYLGFGTYF